MLLPGLQGEDIAALARGVYGLSDDPARHATDELVPRREKSVVRSGEGLVVARTLALPDRHAAAVCSRGFQHSQRDRIDVGDGDRTGVVRCGGEVWGRFEATEKVGLLEDDAGCGICSAAELARVCRAAAVRNLDDLESEAGCVGLHDLAHLRIRRLGDDDLGPTRRMLRDVASVRGNGRPVVAGGVRDVHPRELADGRLVLEDRLQHTLAHLGLIGRVRGEELTALKHRVDDGGDVMVVHARPEERELPGGVDIASRELLEQT